MAETDQIKLAKIGSKQAIVVALITSFAGLLGAAVQKFGFENKPDPIVQDEVRFRGIEFHGQATQGRYRVVIDVDGIPYSYPGRSVWKDAGPKISEQSFPLLAGKTEHSVGVELFFQTADGEEFVAITEQDKTVTSESNTVGFRVLKRGGISRASGAFATVQLEIVEIN